MKRTRLRYGFGIMFGIFTLVVPAVAPAASHDLRATGTVVAKVQFRDAAGALQPLADVEVFLWDGAPHYACTNEAGKATFSSITPGVDLVSATGIGVSALGCANSEFVNPDTGKRMYTVFWNGHHGVAEFDHFQVTAGQQTTIRFKVKTPKQTKVCGGMITTMVGTNGPDNLEGTEGDDVIDGRGGVDVIEGNGGNDIICGGNGGDTLRGGDGDDQLFGEAGKDQLFGEAGDDILFGGLLADSCKTGETLYSCES